MATNLVTPRRREDFFKENGDPTNRFINWIELVTVQSNITSITVENTEQALTSTGSRVSRNAARINSLELKEFEILTTLIDLTTDRNQIILCKNVAPITITLDPQAVAEDEVHIKRRGDTVTVIGLIDGLNDQVINVLNWSSHYVFDGTDWSSI
jgi:hypothetical protein